jgi:heptosyltransferase-2
LNEILAGTSWFNEMVVCDMKGLLGPWRLARAIKHSGADAVLLLPNSFRSALGARLSGAAVRVGYHRDGRGGLLTHAKSAANVAAPVPMVQYYASLADFAFGEEQLDTRLELATTETEQSAASAILRDVKLPFIVLNPGANRGDKRWPSERFAAVGDALAKSHGVSVAVSGSPGEKDVIAAVVAAAKSPMINLAERGMTLGSLKAVIERSALLITNDTGPRHLAAALGTPVVTLFGPTDHRWTTLNCDHERLMVSEPFLPENLVADKRAKACAIDRIPVVDVIDAARSLLDATR